MDRFGGRGDGPPRRGGFSRQAAVKALKESVQTGHKTGLPPNLLSLFAARPPLEPGAKLKKRPPKLPYTGLANYLENFASEGDPEYQPERAPDRPPEPRLFRNREFPTQARIDTETKVEKRLRLNKWKLEEAERMLKESIRDFDPNHDPNIDGDPYKTLIVARLSYDCTEKKLRREMEEFGPVRRVRIVMDKKGKARGYAFVEYESKKDMKEAYKAADGRKIEGRRVLIDVERGRTVENWRPRRLGGGLGGEGRAPKPPKKPKPGVMSPEQLLEERRREEAAKERERFERERAERERLERERIERERVERERFERERAERGERDRERDRDRERKRDREPSPKREREEKRSKRVEGGLEDGEVRDERERDREREREKSRDYDREKRERERDRV